MSTSSSEQCFTAKIVQSWPGVALVLLPVVHRSQQPVSGLSQDPVLTVAVTIITSKESWGAINPLVIGYPLKWAMVRLFHSLHVNVLELFAVLTTLPRLMSKLMGHVVQIEVTRQLWHTSITREGDHIVVSRSAVLLAPSGLSHTRCRWFIVQGWTMSS